MTKEKWVKERILARAWFLDKIPDSQISFNECLSVLRMSKKPFLEYLVKEGLL
jgi:hypothetical protein